MSTSTAPGAAATSGECVARAASRSSRSRSTSAIGRPAGGAAPRSLLVGGEPDLELGVGRDDGADVAALGDPVAVRDQRALLAEQRRADRRDRPRARGVLGDLGRADRLRDVLAVEQHAVAARSAMSQRRAGRARRASATERYIAPAVEVREAERRRDGAGDGRLAGPGGTVDGDEHGGWPR